MGVMKNPIPPGYNVPGNPTLEATAEGEIYGYHIPAKDYVYRGKASARDAINAARPADGKWTDAAVKEISKSMRETNAAEIERRYNLLINTNFKGLTRSILVEKERDLITADIREFLAHMTPARVKEMSTLGKMDLELIDDDRYGGAYERRTHTLKLNYKYYMKDKDEGSRVVFHELLHSIQENDIQMREIARKDFARRIGKEAIKKKVQNGIEYQYYEDQFVEWYQGRLYDDENYAPTGAELLSVAAQYFRKSMQNKSYHMIYMLQDPNEAPTAEALISAWFK